MIRMGRDRTLGVGPYLGLTQIKRPQLLSRQRRVLNSRVQPATQWCTLPWSQVVQSMLRCCRAARFSSQLTWRRPSRSWMRSCRASLSGTAIPFSWGAPFVWVALLALAGPVGTISVFRGRECQAHHAGHPTDITVVISQDISLGR